MNREFTDAQIDDHYGKNVYGSPNFEEEFFDDEEELEVSK